MIHQGFKMSEGAFVIKDPSQDSPVKARILAVRVVF